MKKLLLIIMLIWSNNLLAQTPVKTPEQVPPVKAVEDEDEPPPPLPTPTPKPGPTPSPTKIRVKPTTLANSTTVKFIVENFIIQLPSELSLTDEQFDLAKYSTDFVRSNDGKYVWIDTTTKHWILDNKKENLFEVESVTSYFKANYKEGNKNPQQLLKSEFDKKIKEKLSNSKLSQVRYLTVNGIKGLYTLENNSANPNQFLITWQFFYLKDEKIQRALVRFSGKKSELSVANFALKTIKFEEPKYDVPVKTFREEKISENGNYSFNLPTNLIAKPFPNDTKTNENVSWTRTNNIWLLPSKIEYKPFFKVTFSTSTYNVDFDQLNTDLAIERRTPEFLLLMNHFANLNTQKERPELIKVVDYVELNGVKGSYTLFRFPNSNNFISVWEAYRRFNGKAQSITLTIEGHPSQIAVAEEITGSFKISK